MHYVKIIAALAIGTAVTAGALALADTLVRR